jgi:hypothetical protein
MLDVLVLAHMIRAAGKPGRVELVADGNETVLLRDNEMSFLVGEKTFKITRKGFFGPTYQLWLGEDLVVSLAQTPCFNRYSLAYSEQVWTLKAIGIMARKFGLYQDDKQVGSILPTHLNRYREILIDLPIELPLEVQAFLMWVVLWKWRGDSSG